jgi:ribose transport system ATP-binding protein
MSAEQATAELAPRVSARGLCKSFPGVCALDQVSIDIGVGEVLAVVGENGAGKSTLMRILAGNQKPDAGQVLIDGEVVVLNSPADAMAHRIALIHQELNLADNLSVGENLLLGREPHRFGWIDRGEVRRSAEEYLSKVGLAIDPATPLQMLSIAQKQMVEIAKALSTRANVLIMDEPTSSLSQQETDTLFRLVDELRRSGVSIVYISHRLGEVLRLADRVEVLRDGKNAGSLVGSAIEHDAMVKLMIGREPKSLDKSLRRSVGEVRLEVKEMRVATESNGKSRPPVSFDARGGELLVFAGLVGAGRSELLESVFGIRPADAGEVVIDGKRLRRTGVRESIAAGLALVTEDRKATGLLVESSVRSNTTLAALPWIPSYPWVRPRWERVATSAQMQSLRIKAASQQTVVTTLSGGNQQKIAIAKWLIQKPRVMLLDEPTRGVDIAARQEIYQILLELACDGVAIVIVSSDMEEVLALADRVIVMHEGSVAGELCGSVISEANIMQLAVGASHSLTS